MVRIKDQEKGSNMFPFDNGLLINRFTSAKGQVGDVKPHKVSEDLLKTPRIRSCEHGGEINCVSWAKEGEGTEVLEGFFLQKFTSWFHARKGNRFWGLLEGPFQEPRNWLHSLKGL